ncbi:MAG TPA: hypothetical protein VJJ26_01600 [Candidatus Babeliales bacterium]|nr:hypothetical protein [Candidatus Babeliales bacterium]
MIHKRIIFIGSVLCYSFMVLSMDESDASAKPKHALTRRVSEERITITPEENPEEGPKGKVPSLKLDSVVKESKTSRSGASQTPKTPVTQLEELGRQVQRAKSIRTAQNTQRVVKKRIIVEDEQSRPLNVTVGSVPNVAEDIDDTVEPKKRFSLLPRALVQEVVGQGRIILPDDEKQYSEEEVWAMLELFNPSLHSFGRHHKMDLEELREYSSLAGTFDIDPQVLTELMHKNNSNNGTSQTQTTVQRILDIFFGSSDNQQEAFLNKKYGKIKGKQPDPSEKYKLLMFEAMKAAYDHVDGQPHRSAIVDTHIGLQNTQINDQQAQIRLQYVGLAVTVLTAVGGWVFGIFGQATCPTNSTL